jgi:hypothetical protein
MVKQCDNVDESEMEGCPGTPVLFDSDDEGGELVCAKEVFVSKLRLLMNDFVQQTLGVCMQDIKDAYGGSVDVKEHQFVHFYCHLFDFLFIDIGLKMNFGFENSLY